MLFDWRSIQTRLAGNGQTNWAKCPACNEMVLQSVGTLHIEEEHPEISASLRSATSETNG